ncbi:DUF4400 domain-containing protein [Raoultella sp. BIGb0132]|uniref:DUF4400 domain-containing protein n=1 Tax=Raoultella sp. BIGb0132 TaxID=2940617 RepID=UPI00386213DA
MQYFINKQSHLRIHCLPALKTRIAIDLAGDLVCQDLRRFGAGHESGFVYHHTWCMFSSSLAATGLVWLALPFSVFVVTRSCGDWASNVNGAGVSPKVSRLAGQRVRRGSRAAWRAQQNGLSLREHNNGTFARQ